MRGHKNDIAFDLLENGLDFVLKSLDSLTTSNSNNDLKYALLHLSAGVELILKELLRREHWSLIFGNTDQADFADFQTGDFKSVEFESCLARLENVCDVQISDKDKNYLRSLRKRRNRIEHFAVNENSGSIKSLTSKVLSVLFDLFSNKFDAVKLSKLCQDQIELLRRKSKEFKKFSELRMSKIEADLVEISKDHKVIECPKCFHKSLPLDEILKCYFCGHGEDPEQLTMNYVSNILGISLRDISKGESDPVQLCIDCGAETMVEDNTDWFCFTCGLTWKLNQLSECMSCGQLYEPDSEDYIDMCEDCLKYALDKFD